MIFLHSVLLLQHFLFRCMQAERWNFPDTGFSRLVSVFPVSLPTSLSNFLENALVHSHYEIIKDRSWWAYNNQSHCLYLMGCLLSRSYFLSVPLAFVLLLLNQYSLSLLPLDVHQFGIGSKRVWNGNNKGEEEAAGNCEEIIWEK